MITTRKPSTSCIIQGIIKKASLTTSRKIKHRFTKIQLMELSLYIDNVIKTNIELKKQVNMLIEGGYNVKES